MIDGIRATSASQPISDIQALEHFVVDNPDLERLETLLDQFNIFEAIGVVRQELRHSDFLSFLLNPQQPHGFGDAFLKSLLQKVLLSARGTVMPINLIDLDVWSLEETTVLREWRNIDLLLVNESKQVVVIIENKIGCSEGDNQLIRYYETIEKHYPGWKTIALFLTPEGDQPSDDRYLPVSYKLIAELVEGLAERRVSSLGPDVKALMTHYTQMLRRHIVSESEIDLLCKRIYQKHQRALDLIFERRPDLQTELGEMLESLIVQTNGLVIDRVTKTEIRFVPEAWDDCIPRTEPGWSPFGRVLVFFFDNKPNRLRLILIIGPGEDSLRQHIFDAALANRSHFKPESKTLNKKWNIILSRPILSVNDYSDCEMEDLECKIRSWWTNFVSEDLPVVVEKIRDRMKLYGS